MFTNHLRRTTIVGILVDFSKAFDTVDHTILLKKLEIYGITGASRAWFRSYLTNRKQYICINNYNKTNKTNEQKVTCGVPQGHILGLLLFLIYVNDLPVCRRYKPMFGTQEHKRPFFRQ